MAIEEIYILHHTHVDVGYTDLQSVVHQNHLDFIAQALALCDATDGYPEDAQFRWINEFSWPVASFLKERPALAAKLMKRLREGRMELCGLYLDPTDLYDRRTLAASLQPALKIGREYGVPLGTVMTTDIPGQPWSLPDVMAEHGFRFLSVSPNAMVSKPVHVERPFYWVGPQGGKVLVWLTDWRKGWYGEGHVLGFPQGLEATREGVGGYLESLIAEGYPWRVLALHMGADNHPPFPGLSDLVAGWNERGDLPKMRISTNREFFERMLELHCGEFAEQRAAWPDWWANGAGSAAYETGLSRETHCRLVRIEALQLATGDQTDLWPVVEDLLFYDEHTFGCQDMALEPYSFRSRAMWAHKSLFAYRAWDGTRRIEERLAGKLPGGGQVTVFNPLERRFVGPLALPHLGPDARGLAAEGEAPIPVQHSAKTPLSPATAWTIAEAPPKATRSWSVVTEAPPDGGQLTCAGGVLENEFYRIGFDREAGSVVSVVDRETGRELLDTAAEFGFGETVHERIAGSQDRKAIWDRGQPAIPYGIRRTDAPFRRQGAAEKAKLLGVQAGPVFGSVTSLSILPDVRRLETEVRLWRGLRRIDVEVRMDKRAQEAYESLYVAFPFALVGPRAYVHNAGATFQVETQQLPGSCRDFYAVEHFVALEGDGGWAAVTPVDAPLVQLGGIQTGRWLDHLTLDKAHVYSWLMNNFWYTNFPGYQQGILRFRFAITTGRGALALKEIERFGSEVRVGVSMG